MLHIFLLLVLVSNSCGELEKSARRPSNKCTVVENESGAEIKCTDGSSVQINNGSRGEQGSQGEAGTSCTVIENEKGADIACDDGTDIFISNGIDGIDGEKGEQGIPGEKGNKGKIIYSKPLYVGYLCSRVVLLIGKINYVIHGQLIPINKSGVPISGTCGVKLDKKEIITYVP